VAENEVNTQSVENTSMKINWQRPGAKKFIAV